MLSHSTATVMIPSRGLRWSGQSIGIGRRRLEAFSARSFSSSRFNKPLRSTSLTSNDGALCSRTVARPQVLKVSSILLNSTALRFQSTSSPLASVPTTSPSSNPTSLWPSDVSRQSLDAATDLSSNLDNVTEHIGYLKALGLDYGWGPTAMMEWIIEHIHVYAGTPWWGTIAITAILIRAVMFYAYIGSADNAARMAVVAPLTKPLYDKMRAASAKSDTTEVMKLRQELQIIQRRAGIKLLKSFVPLLQVPVGYGSFMLLRGMAKLPVPGLETGGVLWFQNLAIPDPFFLLPIATAGVLHLVLRRGGEMGVSTISPGAMKLMAYALPAITLLFTWWLPAGVQLSFFVAGVISAGQGLLFRWAPFREFFKMTPMPKRPEPFSKAAEPSPYQPRIITAQQSLSQKIPYSGAQPSAGKYEPPRKPTLLSGLKKEVKSTISSVQASARETYKSAKEYTGQESKDGKRTKAELRSANEYERKRRVEELARQEELDLERRRMREEKRRMQRDQEQ